MSLCGWAVTQCGCGSCWEALSPATRARAAALAIHVMWTATGRRYGACEVTVMPCNPRPQPPLYQTFPVTALGGYGPHDSATGLAPYMQGGQWFNGCGAGCSCRAVCGVDLAGPVDEVVGVRVDGALIDAATYQVFDRRTLVRIGACWPTCQLYGVDVPGFTVTYTRGTPIPAPIQGALELLACQYAAACSGGECRLPPRLTSLARQGVSIELAQVPTENGTVRTGIPLIDDAIQADNPYNRFAAAEVYSPDEPPAPSITWAAP